jgi:hypothetical protein
MGPYVASAFCWIAEEPHQRPTACLSSVTVVVLVTEPASAKVNHTSTAPEHHEGSSPSHSGESTADVSGDASGEETTWTDET